MPSRRYHQAISAIGAVTLACGGNPNSPTTTGGAPSDGGTLSSNAAPTGSGGAVTTSVSNGIGGASSKTGSSVTTGGTLGPSSVSATAGGASSAQRGGQSNATTSTGTTFGGATSSGKATGGAALATSTTAGRSATGTAAGGSAAGGVAIFGNASAGGAAGSSTTSGTATAGKAGSTTGGTAAGGSTPGGSDSGLPKFIIGADISSVDEAMDRGTKFADTDGTSKSIFDILKNHGFNFIRLRSFVKPGANYGYAYGTGGSCIKSETYCDTAHTVSFAKLVKAAGMGLLLDLHYSDNWTDPGNQIIPEDWRDSNTIAELADHVRTYTQDIVGALTSAGARPDIVQVGNETTPGMLIHVPNSNTDCWGNNVSTSSINGGASNWANLGTLLKAGVAGVKAIDSSIKTMVHIENTKSASGVVSWVRNARNQGVAMDIVGLSCYVAFQGEPTVWKAAFDALASAFTDLSFVIAEYNPQRTQANQLMYEMANGRGLGTFFWEPTQSGEWGASMFTFAGNTARANTADFQEFDTFARNAGLK